MNIEKHNSIWLFGPKGFIGRHIFNYFSNDQNICSVGRDFFECGSGNCFEFSNHKELLSELKRKVIENELPIPKVIIYSAGSGSVPLSISNPFLDFESNTSDYYSLLSMFMERLRDPLIQKTRLT